MRYVLLTALLLTATSCTATFHRIGQAVNDILGWLYGRRPCGPCPAVADCREIDAIVLGYCCGCALPIDHVPMVCAPDLICPPRMGKLCADYNYLLDCGCC